MGGIKGLTLSLSSLTYKLEGLSTAGRREQKRRTSRNALSSLFLSLSSLGTINKNK